MKIRYLIMFSLILTVLAIGAVSASQDIDAVADSVDDSIDIEKNEMLSESDADGLLQNDEKMDLNDDSIDIGETEAVSQSDDEHLEHDENGAEAVYQGDEDKYSGYDENSVEVNLNDDERINLNNDSVLAEITAPHNATGEVTVMINDSESPAFKGDLTTLAHDVDENDSNLYIYKIKLANLTRAFKESTYFINVTYGGDDYYHADFDDGNVILADLRSDVEYEFSLDITDDCLIGRENILSFSIPPLVNNCIITLDNISNVLYDFRPTGIGWMISLDTRNLTPGAHLLNLSYPGDDQYKPFSKTINFTCAFIKVYIGDEMVYPRFTFGFAKDATGMVQIFVDNKFYMNKTVAEFINEAENGFPRYEPLEVYYLYLENLGYGSHTYKVIYSGDEKYSLEKPIEGVFNVTYEFDVIELDNDHNENYNIGDPVKFGIFVSDDVKKITVNYNGKSVDVIPTSNDYYDAIVTISDLKSGENNITFTCHVDNCPSKSIIQTVHVNPVENPQNGADANIIVEKSRPEITATNLKVIYSAGTKYKSTVYDNGKAAGNTKVTFLINGKVFKTVTTNAKGVATIKITQKPGTYKITTKALDKSVTYKLTVKHILNLKKVNVKRSAKKLVITAGLAKINGKYLKGKKITLKFNGKKYIAKTNKKGVVKFTINKKMLKKLKAGKKVKYQATYLKDTVSYFVKIKK